MPRRMPLFGPSSSSLGGAVVLPGISRSSGHFMRRTSGHFPQGPGSALNLTTIDHAAPRRMYAVF